MAPSIYIYDCKETYEKMYKGFQDDPMRESPLLDLFVSKDKLYKSSDLFIHFFPVNKKIYQIHQTLF